MKAIMCMYVKNNTLEHKHKVKILCFKRTKNVHLKYVLKKLLINRFISFPRTQTRI